MPLLQSLFSLFQLLYLLSIDVRMQFLQVRLKESLHLCCCNFLIWTIHSYCNSFSNTRCGKINPSLKFFIEYGMNNPFRTFSSGADTIENVLGTLQRWQEEHNCHRTHNWHREYFVSGRLTMPYPLRHSRRIYSVDRAVINNFKDYVMVINLDPLWNTSTAKGRFTDEFPIRIV